MHFWTTPQVPAAVADIHIGDAITSLAGTPVMNLLVFHVILWARRPGETFDVRLEREWHTSEARASLVADRGRWASGPR